MITIKTVQEIAIMRKGGKILARILNEVKKAAKPGISTKELDALAKKLILKVGGEPAFLNYRSKGEESKPFPATICTSINHEVVHSVPDKSKVLKEGDIIGLDIGIRYQGFCTDMAQTIGIGRISTMGRKLIKVTGKALLLGMGEVKPGNYIGDIGAAIQHYVEKEGFSVVRQLVGHGIGKDIHEEPRIPNFGEPGTGPQIQKGMTFAIEPMVNIGKSEVETAKDGWTVTTSDQSLSAHFEHTVAVTKSGCQILTLD